MKLEFLKGKGSQNACNPIPGRKAEEAASKMESLRGRGRLQGAVALSWGRGSGSLWMGGSLCFLVRPACHPTHQEPQALFTSRPDCHLPGKPPLAPSPSFLLHVAHVPRLQSTSICDDIFTELSDDSLRTSLNNQPHQGTPLFPFHSFPQNFSPCLA